MLNEIEEVIKKYPKIFTSGRYSTNIRHMKGWAKLLDILAGFLQIGVDNKGQDQVEILQLNKDITRLIIRTAILELDCKSDCKSELLWYKIKKKMDNYQLGQIRFIEELSACICKKCASIINEERSFEQTIGLCYSCLEEKEKL